MGEAKGGERERDEARDRKGSMGGGEKLNFRDEIRTQRRDSRVASGAKEVATG